MINIGILGCANIAQRSIMPAIKELPECFGMVGVASRTLQTASECAYRFNTRAFEGYQSLVDVADLDAVYIPLPNSMHAEWISKALDRGLHVLVEKSLACTKSEAEQLNEKAQKNRLILLENFQFRFHRQISKIKKIIDSGELGELRCIRSSFGFPPFSDPDNIRYQKELGGGALLDAGAYLIKVSQMLMGNDIYVKAAQLQFDQQKGVDVWGGGFIQQTSGSLFSQIAFGFDHFYQCNIEVWGSLGKLYTNRIFTAPPGFETELVLETTLGKKVINVPADNHFQNMLLYFHKLVQNPDLAKDEYVQNINQSRIIEEFKIKSNE